MSQHRSTESMFAELIALLESMKRRSEDDPDIERAVSLADAIKQDWWGERELHI